MAFEKWWAKHKDQVIRGFIDTPQYQRPLALEVIAEQAWQASAENQREVLVNWIGNVLPEKHPESKALLWGIAEAIERDNFGVVANPTKSERSEENGGT